MEKPRIALQITSEKGFALLPPSQARTLQKVQFKPTLLSLLIVFIGWKYLSHIYIQFLVLKSLHSICTARYFQLCQGVERNRQLV